MESDHCIARPVFCSGELKLEHTGHHILSVDKQWLPNIRALVFTFNLLDLKTNCMKCQPYFLKNLQEHH